MLMYCLICGDDKEFSPTIRKITINIKGERISVNEPVLQCLECGEFQPDIRKKENDAIWLAATAYEIKHGLGSSGIKGL